MCKGPEAGVCGMYEEHKQSLCLEGGSGEVGSNEAGGVGC